MNLYDALKKAIINKSIADNLKLPPSRVLAKDLNISRSTVLKAYDLLIIEKYIKSIPGSGYHIIANTAEKISIPKQPHSNVQPPISKKGQSFNKIIHKVNKTMNSGIAFRPGLPPLDLFPVRQWQKLSNDYWRTIRYSELSYSSPTGIHSLKENILNYLKIYRNIDCDINQIIITTGSLHSLYLISSILINAKDEVIVENPTYPYAYRLFNGFGAKLVSVDVDNEGICIHKASSQRPKLIYTTPSNQHPTGVKMSFDRRVNLLKWATTKASYIIEDDYDHEFSNWEDPIAPIYSIDNQERVFYLGSFNKILHPSIRLGYMIVPHYLVDVITTLFEHSNRFVPPSIQKTLSSFIEKDYLNRHLRNTIKVSNERKKIFHDSFNSLFKNEIQLDSSNRGLNVIGHLKKGVDDKKLAEFFNKIGITTYPLSSYFNKAVKKNGLVMGYCSVNSKLIKDNLLKMRERFDLFEK